MNSLRLATRRLRPAANTAPRRLFSEGGEKQMFLGPPKESQGWEWIVALFYPLITVTFVAAVRAAPEENSMTWWARKEAAARKKLMEAGIAPEWGVHYSNLNQQKFTFKPNPEGGSPILEEIEEVE